MFYPGIDHRSAVAEAWLGKNFHLPITGSQQRKEDEKWWTDMLRNTVIPFTVLILFRWGQLGDSSSLSSLYQP